MCDFDIDFKSTAASLTEEARNAIVGAGGSFSGDTNEGDFEIPSPFGKVKGAYTITGSTIHITITKKPIIASCALLEKELRKRLNVPNE